MEWIIANWDPILEIIAGIISVASIIARITPSAADDKVIDFFIKLINLLAVNKSPKKIADELIEKHKL